MFHLDNLRYMFILLFGLRRLWQLRILQKDNFTHNCNKNSLAPKLGIVWDIHWRNKCCFPNNNCLYKWYTHINCHIFYMVIYNSNKYNSISFRNNNLDKLWYSLHRYLVINNNWHHLFIDMSYSKFGFCRIYMEVNIVNSSKFSYSRSSLKDM